jgi:hypothetical protein
MQCFCTTLNDNFSALVEGIILGHVYGLLLLLLVGVTCADMLWGSMT